YIWYIAVAFTTTAKLTAIFNTSCFWAYVFSILLLGDSLQKEKILAVFLSIMGVAIMTFWDISQDDNPSADKNSKFDNNDEDRSLINMGDFIALVGALAYGLNEVIYKKYASPSTPSCLFSNTITALIGVFTFFNIILAQETQGTIKKAFDLSDIKLAVSTSEAVRKLTESLTYPNSLSTLIQLNQGDDIKMIFTIRDEKTQKGIQPHQAFLVLSSENNNKIQLPFIVQVRESGKASVKLVG
ncbi:9951_t:CDS:2, partial [Entrophospora sp. SA101]